MNKLDLIIDALEMVLVSSECEKYYEALAAARELRALEPVAWSCFDDEGIFAVEIKKDHLPYDSKTPLYALGDTNE